MTISTLRQRIHEAEIAEGVVLTEHPLSRVWQLMNSPQPCAMITAFRSDPKNITTHELLQLNMERNASLINMVRAAGYGFFVVDGSWIEHKGTPLESHTVQRTLMIAGPANGKAADDRLLKNLIIWTRAYKQEASLFKSASSNRMQTLWADGRLTDLGEFHPDKMGEYYSKMIGQNHTFVFEAAYVQGGLGAVWKSIAERREAERKQQKGEGEL